MSGWIPVGLSTCKCVVNSSMGLWDCAKGAGTEEKEKEEGDAV